MKIVNVNLGADSYAIHIGHGLLAQANIIQSAIKTKQVCIVTNPKIADLYLSKLQASLLKDNDLSTEVVILPEGEQHKNQSTLDLIHNRLIEKKFSRDCLLIALGGGIVGDITGFAAATYQRGVNFIQVPTTLLAQVDSSVGGKTGINHRLGKNLIGAFHQPKAVFIDTEVLRSLPPREMAAGLAEVIKYGLIRDKAFLEQLDTTLLDETLFLNTEFLERLIETACQHKANVVANDEKENGERATLNLGHTFGHAVEALTEYRTYLHGESVAIGTMMAAELSQAMGWLKKEEVSFIEQLFKRAHCPVRIDNEIPYSLSAEKIREAMQRDKKVLSGKLKLILLSSLGQAIICEDIDETLILQAIRSRI
ncbi:MAG: 3-dehydroquinate synthase [Ostreibacterium sp.]